MSDKKKKDMPAQENPEETICPVLAITWSVPFSSCRSVSLI